MSESWSAVSVGSMNSMFFDMWKAGHMVKVGWIWMGTYLFVDLEGCPAAKFPGVEYICGGNGCKALQSFGQ